jgi:hypothetical protein
MTRTRLAIFIVSIWAVLFVLSFVLAFSLEPTGDGFTRGLNRLSALIVWQGVAILVAIVALLAGLGIDKSTPKLRWVSRIPALVHLTTVLLIVGLILFLRFTKPPAEPYVPPGPATEAAAPVNMPVKPLPETAPVAAETSRSS